MTNKPGGEPAFPVIAENGLGHISSGMSKRELGAFLIAAGLAVHPGLISDIAKPTLAELTIKLTDKLLLELSKPDGENCR